MSRVNHARLRAVHAVGATGSFTRAAQMLHVTQPTVSGQVGALEEDFGVELFERRARGVVPTELGRALLEITHRHFGFEEEAERLLKAAGELVTGHLRVGADSPYNVFPLLAGFGRRYPGVRLSIAFGNSEQVLHGLLERESDIGVLAHITTHPLRDERLAAVPLRPDRLVVFVHRGHPWAARRSIALHELAAQRVILREPGSTTRALIERVLRQRQLALVDTLEVGSREGVREAVAAGLGVGIVFEGEFGADSRLYALRLRDVRLRAMEYVVCLRDRSAERGLRAFFESLPHGGPVRHMRPQGP